MPDHLHHLEQRSIHLIREAYARFDCTDAPCPPIEQGDGQRYRSLGEAHITCPVSSTAATLSEVIIELETTKSAERAGRAMDHEREDAFERLRAAGCM